MTIKLEQEQKITQTQKITITAQIKQSLELLQKPLLDLREIVKQKLLENPLLDEVETEPETQQEYEENERLSKKEFEADPLTAEFEKNINEEVAESDNLPDDWEEFLEKLKSGPTAGRNMALPDPDELTSIEEWASAPASLVDYLIWQVHVGGFSERESAIAEEIIGNINDRGYLPEGALEDIAEKLNVSLEEVNSVHRRILRLDPPGVAARNLKECLLAQAKAIELEDDSVVIQLIQNHLEDITKVPASKLAKKLKVSEEEVEQAIEIIKSFDPIPGRNLVPEEPRVIIPDVYVEKAGNDYIVRVNDTEIPRLRINSQYETLLRNPNVPDEAKRYIKEKLSDAKNFIKALHRRPSTIQRVAQFIVENQRDFLEKGPDYIKPMTLREVAEALEFHESTISRATSNKYMQTPLGVFRMNIFFQTGIQTRNGEHIATNRVKTRIRQIIESEDKEKPYTDDQIAKMLKAEGIEISRRTVAKYRDQMGIPSRSRRRKKL